MTFYFQGSKIVKCDNRVTMAKNQAVFALIIGVSISFVILISLQEQRNRRFRPLCCGFSFLWELFLNCDV